MRVGIVGHEAAKFTSVTEEAARLTIRVILYDYPTAVIVSGKCPLGGIDIWAIEEAKRLGREYEEYAPKTSRWEDGFKPRNLLIAASDIVHCIVVEELPAKYTGRRFPICYHCKDARPPHVKSGGCWTAMRCQQSAWHIITPDGNAYRVGYQNNL